MSRLGKARKDAESAWADAARKAEELAEGQARQARLADERGGCKLDGLRRMRGRLVKGIGLISRN